MVAVEVLLALLPAVLCGLAAKMIADRRGVIAWPWMVAGFVFLLFGLAGTAVLAGRLGRPIAQ